MNNLLFLLSAIGGLNGFFLSLYFAFFTKHKSRSTYFLAALIAVVSVRITKSAFLYFSYQSSIVWFIQVGLIACALIGPFLYLYTRASVSKTNSKSWLWVLHVVPVIVLLVILFSIHPYERKSTFWGYVIGTGIYNQWLVYVCLSLFLIRHIILKLFSKEEKLTNKELWLLNLVFGVTIIWIAYRTSWYTSYIVGALSFSFIFYMSALLWILKRKQSGVFFETATKYNNKSLTKTESQSLAHKLDTVVKEKKLFKNSNLKLQDLAKEIDVTSHLLSQFLNDNLKKTFNQFINEHRILEAKQLIVENNQFTLEAIGYEAGFSSKSTFYATFKKVTGITPAAYKKQLLA